MRSSLNYSRLIDLNYVKKKVCLLDRLDSLGYISQMKLAIRPVVLSRR